MRQRAQTENLSVAHVFEYPTIAEGADLIQQIKTLAAVVHAAVAHENRVEIHL